MSEVDLLLKCFNESDEEMQRLVLHLSGYRGKIDDDMVDNHLRGVSRKKYFIRAMTGDKLSIH